MAQSSGKQGLNMCQLHRDAVLKKTSSFVEVDPVKITCAADPLKGFAVWTAWKRYVKHSTWRDAFQEALVGTVDGGRLRR